MQKDKKKQPYIDDTDPKAKEIQVSLIRKAGIAERARHMRELSGTVINLSRRAISRTHPEYDQKQIDLMFVSIHYGGDLARRLEDYLDKKAL